jgi:hypothetical protein
MVGAVRRRSATGDLQTTGLKLGHSELDDVERRATVLESFAAGNAQFVQVFLGLRVIAAGNGAGATV